MYDCTTVYLGGKFNLCTLIWAVFMYAETGPLTFVDRLRCVSVCWPRGLSIYTDPRIRGAWLVRW